MNLPWQSRDCGIHRQCDRSWRFPRKFGFQCGTTVESAEMVTQGGALPGAGGGNAVDIAVWKVTLPSSQEAGSNKHTNPDAGAYEHALETKND